LTYRVTTSFSDIELGALIVELAYGGTTLSLPGSRTDATVQARFEALDTTGLFAASDEDENEESAFARVAHLWHAFNIGVEGDWFTVTFDHEGQAPPVLTCAPTEVANKDGEILDTTSVECSVQGH
jgi:hypothetical protein